MKVEINGVKWGCGSDGGSKCFSLRNASK